MKNSIRTPKRAFSLVRVYNMPGQLSRVLAVGDPERTLDWSSHSHEYKIQACRSWDRDLIQKVSSDVDMVILQEVPNDDWRWIIQSIHSKICVIRHSLPIASALQDVAYDIPSSHQQYLKPNHAYGKLMLGLLQQDKSYNPISLLSLSNMMTGAGWYYVCDLCSHRDFGATAYAKDPIEQREIHSSQAGMLWRDSIFMRHLPRWNPHALDDQRIVWRAQEEKLVEKGYLYKTREGLLLGVESNTSLLNYTQWKDLRREHSQILRPLVHSCLVSFL